MIHVDIHMYVSDFIRVQFHALTFALDLGRTIKIHVDICMYVSHFIRVQSVLLLLRLALAGPPRFMLTSACTYLHIVDICMYVSAYMLFN